MKRKISEWLSIQIAKRPGAMVVLGILIYNVLFIIVAASIISGLSLRGTEHMNFLEAAFCTITMILDAGCIQFVIADIGKAGVAITITCLIIIIVGMLSFTGAVIGYVTNVISDFISNANAGDRALRMSEHVVILNWNTRASEIINDLMYCDKKQKVAVLVKANKDDIEREINERLSDTVNRENKGIEKNGAQRALFHYGFARRYSDKVTVVVREGDVFSSKQLRDISLDRAKSIIILGDESEDAICAFQNKERREEKNKGNSQTIKTLMQVADITAAADSNDDQKVIVEITDEWTWEIVSRIIEYKQVSGKCNIVPVRVNKVLGQLLAQFSIMPELNIVYQELLSNRGMSFYALPDSSKDETKAFRAYLHNHLSAIPLSYMDVQGKSWCYYAAENECDISKAVSGIEENLKVDINLDFWMEQKNVVILGHNSKLPDIMEGFNSFSIEWGRRESDERILRILIIDDDNSLRRMDYFKDYSFVTETVSADIYDKDIICSNIERFAAQSKGDISILILSDDMVTGDEVDSGALANLVYVQDIIMRKKRENPSFDVKSMDPIVEIINPKHHDIVNNYSVNNVVISNRYISKMIMQIGENDALFEFYKDILTFDTDISTEGYDSKEVYIKRADRFFNRLPERCTAKELIEAVYLSSSDDGMSPDKRNPSIILGYIRDGRDMRLFKGDQTKTTVDLRNDDLLIVYSAH